MAFTTDNVHRQITLKLYLNFLSPPPPPKKKKKKKKKLYERLSFLIKKNYGSVSQLHKIIIKRSFD